MDNVNYNFKIVELLYKAKQQNGNDPHFNKPIILILMAIVECMMYDLIKRITQHRNDPFPNMDFSIVSFFRVTPETDFFEKLINRFQSQNLFRVLPGDSLYDDLEQLRKVRNRLHIQNRRNLLDKDEYNVFTSIELSRAERSFERVCEILCNTYPRWNKQPLPMTAFPKPW